jgi:hypothetical protein
MGEDKRELILSGMGAEVCSCINKECERFIYTWCFL